jgi:hypothetical protein
MSFTVTEDEKRAIGLSFDSRKTSDGLEEEKREFAKQIQARIKSKKEDK